MMEYHEYDRMEGWIFDDDVALDLNNQRPKHLYPTPS